jgi:hypothetical protein
MKVLEIFNSTIFTSFVENLAQFCGKLCQVFDITKLKKKKNLIMNIHIL